MNGTNRALNRLFLLIVGLLLVAAGAVPIAIVAVPGVKATWTSIAGRLSDGAQPWVADPVVGRASWLVLGVAVVALVLIVLLLAFIGKQGRGRSSAALVLRGEGRTTRVDLAVPKALLEEHLEQRDELAGLRISAYEVRGTPMLKITARCRRGVSPAEVADLVARAVADLERIVGADVPVFVQLTGGFRFGAAPRPQVA